MKYILIERIKTRNLSFLYLLPSTLKDMLESFGRFVSLWLFLECHSGGYGRLFMKFPDYIAALLYKKNFLVLWVKVCSFSWEQWILSLNHFPFLQFIDNLINIVAHLGKKLIGWYLHLSLTWLEILISIMDPYKPLLEIMHIHLLISHSVTIPSNFVPANNGSTMFNMRDVHDRH